MKDGGTFFNDLKIHSNQTLIYQKKTLLSQILSDRNFQNLQQLQLSTLSLRP